MMIQVTNFLSCVTALRMVIDGKVKQISEIKTKLALLHV